MIHIVCGYHFSNRPFPNLAGTISMHQGSPEGVVSFTRGLFARPSEPLIPKPTPGALRHVVGSPNLRREVEGQVLMTQEHQPSPPEPDVRLVTASGSHGISYAFLIHMGCMPDQRDASRHILRDGSSDGMSCRQEFVCGS